MKRKKQAGNAAEKKAFVIAGDSGKDHAVLYKPLLAYGAMKDRPCPTVLPYQELPGPKALCYKESADPRIICTDRSLSEEETVRAVLGIMEGAEPAAPISNPESIPFSGEDMTVWYYNGLIACERLKVRCPLIAVAKELPGFDGIADNDPGVTGKTRIIYLNGKTPEIKRLQTLFHELRHCWQRENDLVSYCSGYSFCGMEWKRESLKDYLLQKAEVDANAFALMMFRDMGLQYRWTGYAEVDEAIRKRARELASGAA